MSGQWLGHALRRTRWRPRREAVALGTLGLVVGIIIGALYLAQAASTSTLGRQLEETIAVRNQLEQENERLRGDIASLQSVPRLLARAQELGFTLASRAQIEYLVVEGYNPNRNQIVTQAQTAREPSLPLYDESFGGWLQLQLDRLSGQFESFTSQGATPDASSVQP
jgi:hypothetical protein